MSKDITVANNQISLGIDTISGLTKIQQGYSRLIKNLNLNSSGWLEKRTGYQVRSGVVPMKIFDITYVDGGDQNFSEIIFDPMVSLGFVDRGPISITNKELTKNIYVDEYRWKVIANKKLDSGTPSFENKITDTSFCNYIVRNQDEDTDEVVQVLGGVLEYSRLSGEPAKINFDFSEYFTATPDGELTVVPIELASASGDGLDFCVKDLNNSNPLKSSRQDKIFDMSIFKEDRLINQGNNTWQIVIPESDRTNTLTDSTVVYDPVTDLITFNFQSIFSNTLLVTQAFDIKQSDKQQAHPEKTLVRSDGSFSMSFRKDEGREVEDQIKDMIIFARQTSSDNFQISVISEKSTVVLDNIEDEFNFYKVYAKEGDDYVEVWADSIIHDKLTKTTTINLTSNNVDTVLIVWEKAETPLNRIQVDGDLREFDKGHVYGIAHKNNYLPEATYGGRIAGLINRSDVGSQELFASLGGNFYSDVKGENNAVLAENPYYYLEGLTSVNIKSTPANGPVRSEDYYIPSPIIRATILGDQVTSDSLYYGPRFISNEDLIEISGLKGRGFGCTYRGLNIVDDEGYIKINKSDVIYNPATKELSFSFSGDYQVVRTWNDPTSYLNELFTTDDLITITDSGSPELNGVHKVTSFDLASGRVTMLIESAGASFGLNKVAPNFRMGCFTIDLMTTVNTLSVGDVIDQKLFVQDKNVEVIKADKLNATETLIVLNNVHDTRAIPTGLTLAGSSFTDRLYFDSIYNVVASDMLQVNGKKVPLKIKSIENVNIVDGNPEIVIVTVDTKTLISDPIVNRLDVFKVGRWNPILGPEDTLDDFQLLDQYSYTSQEPVNMEIIKDIILIDNYANTTKKYDGDKIYRAGLPNWRPIYNIYQDFDAKNKISVQKIDGQKIKFETQRDSVGTIDRQGNILVRSYEMSLEGEVSWESYVGREFGFYSRYVSTDPNTVGEVFEKRIRRKLKSVSSVINPLIDSGGKPYIELQFEGLIHYDLLTLGIELDQAGLYSFREEDANAYIGVPQTYSYMSRLYSTDSQGNKIISRNCGFQDYEITQVFDSAIAVQLKIPDQLLNKRNNGNWEIELIRTKADAPLVYYFITARKLEDIKSDRIIIYDAQSDTALLQGDLDSLSGFVSQGDTLATLIDGPAKALYSTTSNNRYIQANIQGEEIAELTIITQLDDPNFSYFGEAPFGNNATYRTYNSRINNSQIKVVGQSYLDQNNSTRSVEYIIKPQMLESATDVDSLAVGTAILESQITQGKVRFRLLPSYMARNFPDGFDDMNKVVGCTIHLPDFDYGLFRVSDRASLKLGPIQGTVKASLYYDENDENYYVEADVDPLFEYTNEDIGRTNLYNLSLHTLKIEEDKDVYNINVPLYPAMFVRDSISDIEYLGQLYDFKSAKYKNSLGQLVGSQMTDVQEYIYHLQEVLDRASRFADEDTSYPVFPFYTSRDATDKFKITFSPKSDDIEGYSFQWKNGVQTLLAYNGLIIDSESYKNPDGSCKNAGCLSDPFEFKKKVFPSRVVLSAENYPEVFDNPYVDNTTDEAIAIGSSSAIDVNADDGQEITGIQSFLSESIFSAANLDSILLVFKTTSVYALDINTKKVSKIETSGVGCNIPNSIQSTSVGITFANDDGIYVITRNLDMQYLGRPMQGVWSDQVDTSVVGKISSFNNTKEREFYLSVPTVDGEHYTLSYDYALMGATAQIRPEGWTIFDGFIPSVWTKTSKNYYYGGYDGIVFEDRDSGEATDYRDDESGISAVLEYAPTSFGDSGTRASLSKVISHFDYLTDVSNMRVSVSVDTSSEFKHCGTINMTDNNKRTRSIKVRPVESRGLYFQVRYEHDTIDQSFKLTGIDYKAKEQDDELWEEADE